MEVEQLPQRADVGQLEVVNRKLQLVGLAHIGVSESGRPLDLVDALLALEESGQPFEAVSQLHRDDVQVDAAALLEVSELRDLQTVQHHLPADAPGAERG